MDDKHRNKKLAKAEELQFSQSLTLNTHKFIRVIHYSRLLQTIVDYFFISYKVYFIRFELSL